MKLLPAPPVDGDEIGGLENGEMLGHRLTGHRHAGRHLPQRLAAGSKQTVEQRAATLIGKGAENLFHTGGYMQPDSCMSSAAALAASGGSA